MRQLRNCFLIELYSSSLGVLGRPFGQPATQAHAATAATFSDTTTTSASPGAREGRGRREGETASAGRRQVRNSYVSIPLEELEGEGGRAEVVVAGTVTAAAGAAITTTPAAPLAVPGWLADWMALSTEELQDL